MSPPTLRLKPILRHVGLVLFAGFTACIFLMACGAEGDSGSSAATPILTRADPASVKRGNTMIVYGSSFSEEEDNIVFIGGIAVITTDWDVAATGNSGEAEQLSFTVPQNATVGAQELIVLVGDATSNALSVTVEE